MGIFGFQVDKWLKGKIGGGGYRNPDLNRTELKGNMTEKSSSRPDCSNPRRKEEKPEMKIMCKGRLMRGKE